MASDEAPLRAAVRRIRDVGRAASVGALAIGAVEVVGVAGGIDALTAPFAEGPPVSGMAAATFTLAAVALVVDTPASYATSLGSKAVGVVVAFLGVVALLDNLVDVWPGVGMPSIAASISLILLGAAVALVDRETSGGKRPADALGVVVGFVGLVTLLGHLLGAPQLYRPAPDHGTALAGSLCMCLLAVGVLCARPERGLVALLASSTAGGRTARRLGLGALAGIPALTIAVTAAQRVFAFDERTAFALVASAATALSLAVIAIISTDLDRSDREAAHLREVEALAHERLQTVIDQMPEPLLIADAAGEVSDWNRAADAARGHADVVDDRGRPTVLDIRQPSGAPLPSSELPIAVALKHREAVTGIELLLKTRGGALLPVIASAAPLRDRDGRIHGAVAVFDDISVLKRLEHMREEWTAVIAHDLRQPLNGIALHAQILQRALGSAAPEAELESIQHIRVACQRQNRMIGDLLDATRIEATRLKLDRSGLALPPFVHEILERMPEASQHAVRFDAEADLPLVLVDAARVEQVISNLVSNAAKYGAEGTAIGIRIARDGMDVRVSVTNEGVTITTADFTRLFTRFYRTPSAEAGPKRGLGLGLYISKGLIEAHGGRIWAESRASRTTFHFTLPAAEMAPVTDGSAARSVAVDGAPPPQLSGTHALH